MTKEENIDKNKDIISEEEKADKSIAKVDETPVEETKVDEAPAEEAKVDETPVEETKVDEAPAEEAKVDEAPAEEAKVDEAPVEETKADEGSVKDENLPKFVFTNLIGKKIGMTQLFSDEGNVYPATIIEAGPCSVTQVKNLKNDGYDSIQIGFLNKKNQKVNKPTKGHFEKSNSDPKKVLKEFRVNDVKSLPELGDIVDLRQFNVGDFITVKGTSIGKGFAGHMKRHGFGGGRASHGKNSVMRKAGSVGAGTDPGRIFPGMKMAGRMGGNKVTVKNLQVLNIDYDNNLVFVKGAVPGPNNNYLFLTKN